MEVIERHVCPLNLFIWDTPAISLPPIGTKSGQFAEMWRFLEILDTSFDLIVGECQALWEDPIFATYREDAFCQCVLNKHQFNMLRYGIVLNAEQRLVLLEAPCDCTDSGKKIKRERKAVLPLAAEEISHPPFEHSLVGEHNLVVIRLPSGPVRDEKECQHVQPELLFRLVFRNEAYLETPLASNCEVFPLFRLHGVFVPYRYHEMVKNARSSYLFDPLGAKPLAEEAACFSSEHAELIGLLDAWTSIREGITPEWDTEDRIALDLVNLFPLQGLGIGERNSKKSNITQLRNLTLPRLDKPIRMNYLSNGPRLRNRIRIVRKEPDMIHKWRAGAFDFFYYDNKKEIGAGENLGKAFVSCTRMILRPCRCEKDSFQDNELCAFKPDESEYLTQRHVYPTPAAECLRLWVLKGLITAELHDVHVLLLELDSLQVLGQCVGILWDADATTARHCTDEAKFHVCKIVLETIEDYLQHCGVIWYVTLAVVEEPRLSMTQICNDILEIIYASKARLDFEAHLKYHSKIKAQQMGKGGLKQHQKEASPDGGVVVREKSTARHAFSKIEKAVLLANDFFADRTSPQETLEEPERSALQARDATIYPVFKKLCKPDSDTILVKEIVQLLTQKLHAYDDQNGKFLWQKYPLLILDGHAVPPDEARVNKFVMRFCLRKGTKERSSSLPEDSVPSKVNSPALSYVEFSTMMLALASL